MPARRSPTCRVRSSASTSELTLLGTPAATSIRPQLGRALLLWHQYAPVLDPVVTFNGQPYVDSDTAGSALSREGREHYAEVKRAQLFATDNARPLQDAARDPRHDACSTRSSDAAARLRTLLFAGVLAALVLAAAAAYFQITRARHERAAREAQEQTRDILKTVREGFFLLDANYRIGSVWSDALTRMFSRNDFAGLTFEELLQGPRAAGDARDRDQVHQAAVGRSRPREPDEEHQPARASSRSPWTTGTAARKPATCSSTSTASWAPEGIKHVLCSVGDITSSVLLARELQESQENANAQLDMMLGMMHVDPLQLVSFLDTAETGLKLVNTILQGAGAHRRGVPQEAQRAVPRAALHQGRGLGAQPEEHRQPRARARGHGQRPARRSRSSRATTSCRWC